MADTEMYTYCHTLSLHDGLPIFRIWPSAPTPWVRTSSKTITARPAAGPLTWSGEPAIIPTTSPPMIPVIRPFSGGSPDATAMPLHRGLATRNTTSDAAETREQHRAELEGRDRESGGTGEGG